MVNLHREVMFMVSQKKIKSLAVYLAVVLLVFALCVPVLQKKLKERPQSSDFETPQVVNNHSPENTDITLSAPELSLSHVNAPAPILEANLSEMVWPLQGQVFRGVGISYAQTFSDYRYHNGIDIQAARGAEVVAVLPGKIIDKETSKEEGTKITIEHGQGWVSVYAHLEEAYLQVGDYCQKGQSLGTVNQPGLQEVLEGPHLHYTLYQDDQVINPLDYLPEMP